MDKMIEHVIGPGPIDSTDPVVTADAAGNVLHNDVVFIEVLDKHDSVIERHRFNRLPLTLGAAYSNDFIVEPSSSSKPLSLALERDESGDLRVRALEGSESFWAPGGMTRMWRTNPERAFIIAGQRLRVRPRAYVPSAKSVASAPLPMLGRFAWAWSLLLVIASFVGITWLNDIDGSKLVTYLTSGLGIIMVLIIWAGIWALVSRLTGRSTHFLTHLAVGALAFASLTVIDYSFDTVAFAFNLSWIQRYDYALMGAIFGVAAWVHGHWIARVRNITAIITALLIGGGLFATQAAGHYALRGNLASTQTLTEIRPPAVRVVSGSNVDKFFEDANELKELAEKSRPEKPEGIDFGSYDSE